MLLKFLYKNPTQKDLQSRHEDLTTIANTISVWYTFLLYKTVSGHIDNIKIGFYGHEKLHSSVVECWTCNRKITGSNTNGGYHLMNYYHSSVLSSGNWHMSGTKLEFPEHQYRWMVLSCKVTKIFDIPHKYSKSNRTAYQLGILTFGLMRCYEILHSDAWNS